MKDHVCPSCTLFWDVEDTTYFNPESEWGKMCPNCTGEGMEIDVMPLEAFFKQVSLEHMKNYRESWLAQKDAWMPAWWQSKLDQLDKLITMKSAADEATQ